MSLLTFFGRRISTLRYFLLALETFACKCVSTQQAKRVLNGNKIAVFRFCISQARGEEKLNVVKRRERRRFPYRSTARQKRIK